MKTTYTLKHLIAGLLVICAGARASAATFTVTRTADDVFSGSLRWAITQANSSAGADIISFNIGVVGNTFENNILNSWAVITLTSALPVITEAVTIDGTTQSNTNTGFVTGRTVGTDNVVQGNVNYPDVYITCGYTLPDNGDNFQGNGLAVNAPNVTIRGLAISGFGNRSNVASVGIAHADISVLYASANRTMNTVISDCFLSCDPRGAYPATDARRTKGNSILVLGNNNTGTIFRNYVASSGMYGIVFYALQDNLANTTINAAPSSGWLVEENQIGNVGLSALITSGGRASDCISMMTVTSSTVRENYIQDWEQCGIDMGHNTDDNLIENNTLTNYTRTTGSAPCAGIRLGFSSERNNIRKNVIANNTSTAFLAGIYMDEATSPIQGAVVKNNAVYTIFQNRINNNAGSGILLGTNGSGSLSQVTISQNTIYEHTGLGIDLGYANLAGPTAVTVNDNGDGDTGPNNMLNFPVIDDVLFNPNTRTLTVQGKAPANSTIEFFITDGGTNMHGGRSLNYGEGRTYLATGVENSASDLATGTGSYNFDGNQAVNNQANFRFVFSLPELSVIPEDLTSTATLAGSTSEFGPRSAVLLGAVLGQFSAAAETSTNVLRWTAAHDGGFSHFEVERSTDGFKFLPISRVLPQGAAQATRSYQYTDRYAAPGLVYYRLKMADLDGNFTYSNMVSLHRQDKATPGLTATPNPFSGNLNLSFSTSRAGAMHLQVYGVDGSVVCSKMISCSKGQNAIVLPDLLVLPAGIYHVVLQGEGLRQQCQIVKQ